MLHTTGEERWQAESARLDTEIRRLLSRREPYEQLEAAVESGTIEDPLVRRQAELLLNAHRPNQLPADVIERIVALEKAVENRFNTFRAELDGDQVGDNRIREILERSDDARGRRPSRSARRSRPSCSSWCGCATRPRGASASRRTTA